MTGDKLEITPGTPKDVTALRKDLIATLKTKMAGGATPYGGQLAAGADQNQLMASNILSQLMYGQNYSGGAGAMGGFGGGGGAGGGGGRSGGIGMGGTGSSGPIGYPIVPGVPLPWSPPGSSTVPGGPPPEIDPRNRGRFIGPGESPFGDFPIKRRIADRSDNSGRAGLK